MWEKNEKVQKVIKTRNFGKKGSNFEGFLKGTIGYTLTFAI